MDPRFQRHFDACNTAVLPGGRTPFHLGSIQVGWLAPAMVEALRGVAGVTHMAGRVTLAAAEDLPQLGRTLADRGMYRFRCEAFDVREAPGGPALAQLDRGALPAFGVRSEGIHLHGLVGDHIWVARRAASKPLDPGKLDHLAAGGISAGMDDWETLIKESAEEAAIPKGLATRAVKTGTISYAMDRPEGLRRDTLHCYELELPESFVPVAADGEVESFALWPIARAIETVRDTDDFKFNVNLVLIDLFMRRGLI